jgi:stage II sporulation protein AA (anti-sigma F factor antagonist)
MNELFSVEIETTDGQAVVALGGELDLSGVPRLDEVLSSLDSSVQTLVIDLARLSFMDSSGLGAIVRAQQRSDAAGRRLQVRGARGAVRKLLDIAALGATVEVLD